MKKKMSVLETWMPQNEIERPNSEFETQWKPERQNNFNSNAWNLNWLLIFWNWPRKPMLRVFRSLKIYFPPQNIMVKLIQVFPVNFMMKSINVIDMHSNSRISPNPLKLEFLFSSMHSISFSCTHVRIFFVQIRFSHSIPRLHFDHSLFYAYVEIHQLWRLFFGNYQ